MSQRYDIFFAAQLVEGFEEATVRGNLATLFKANDQTLDKLFSGKAQLIKRGVDKQAALKYKAALQKAGAVALIRAAADAAAGDPAAAEAAAVAAESAPEPAPEPAPPPATVDEGLPSSSDIKTASSESTETAQESGDDQDSGSMADRIAALAAEPESTAFGASDPASAAADATEPASAASAAAASAAAGSPAAGSPAAGSPAAATGEEISLAPPGSDVLNEDEREVFEELDIDTSAIHLVSSLSDPEPMDSEPPPPAPDTSHMSMGEVGEEIPRLESDEIPLDPDTSHLSMGKVGEDIPHLEEEVELLDPDTSSISLAPEGSDVLEEEYRKHEEATPPNTDHISLED